MRTLGKEGKRDFRIMLLEDRLAKVLVLEEKGEHEKAKLIGTKDFPLWDYLQSLSDDERDRYLFNNDRGYCGQLRLI